MFNKKTQKTIEANKFFNKNENEIWKYREELQKVIQGIEAPVFVCYACGQNIKINGGGKTKKILHFAHQKDSDFCKLKTDNKLSKREINRVKYNGAKESKLHIDTKNLIYQFLSVNKDFSNIHQEKVKKDNKDYLSWRKPDVSAKYKNTDIVFEIQLSTTFLSVIIEREHFYKENQTFILWIFKKFDTDYKKQRFTDKDIFYTNNRNAFVLDEKAIKLSHNKKNLFLNCFYLKPINKRNELKYEWNNKYVSIQELIFDEKNYKIFYFDVEHEEQKLKNDIFRIKNELAEKQRIEKIKKPSIEENNDYQTEYIEEELTYQEKCDRETNLKFEEKNQKYISELKNKNKLTAFQQIFISDFHILEDRLKDFFRSRILEKEDKIFINKIFRKALQSKQSIEKPQFEYFVAVSIFLNKISFQEKLLDSYNYKIESHLFAILSLKYKRVFGFGYNNLIQIVNLYSNPKNRKYPYFHLIIKAIKEYYGMQIFLLNFDKSGILKNKIETDLWKTEKNEDYNEIIKVIFPEIKETFA